jgi:hypothetical protein
MTYIDSSKRELYQNIYILEVENELLRAKIKKLQNELLDSAKQRIGEDEIQQDEPRNPIH